MSTINRRQPGIPTRRYARYAPYRELAVTYEGHSEAVPVRAPDISTHGIFIHTQQRFPEGAVLRIEFRLTRTDYQVRARGEVRYCLPGVGVGVEFVEISPEAQRAIEEETSGLDAVPPAAQ